MKLMIDVPPNKLLEIVDVLADHGFVEIHIDMPGNAQSKPKKKRKKK